MKYLITKIAAVMLVGCGESQSPDMRLVQSIKDKDINATKNAFNDGADVNANMVLDWDEMRPLHQAVGSSRMGIAELLIEKGADVNAKEASGTHKGMTPLDCAIRNKRTETADLLSKHGGKRGKELKTAGN